MSRPTVLEELSIIVRIQEGAHLSLQSWGKRSLHQTPTKPGREAPLSNTHTALFRQSSIHEEKALAAYNSDTVSSVKKKVLPTATACPAVPSPGKKVQPTNDKTLIIKDKPAADKDGSTGKIYQEN